MMLLVLSLSLLVLAALGCRGVRDRLREGLACMGALCWLVLVVRLAVVRVCRVVFRCFETRVGMV